MAKRSLFTLISSILTLLTLSAIGQNHLVSSTFLGKASKATFQVLSPLSLEYDANYYKITYNTVDVDGSSTIASGLIAVPIVTNVTPLPLLAYCHGTVLHDDDVPSRNNTEASIGKIFACDGYVVVMPDYLGLGDHPGTHPYVHAQSEATATLDAMRAAKEFVENEENLLFNDEVFITGYSQGGHGAMATYKYIQDNNLFNEFNVLAATPCSEPYQLSGVQAQDLLRGEPYSNPGYAVYLLLSYELAYGNIFNTYSDILQSPYDSLIPPLFDGTHNMLTVNALLPNELDSFMNPSFLNAFRSDSINKTHPLWQALIDNDNYNWTPQRPLRMYYCTEDEQVFYENSLLAQDAMKNNGGENIKAINSGALDHGGCVLAAVSNAAVYMDSLRSTPSSIPEIIANSSEIVSIYPNPAKETTGIYCKQKPSKITIYGLTGNIKDQLNGRFNSVDVSSYKPGVYIISFQFDNDILYEQLIIQD